MLQYLHLKSKVKQACRYVTISTSEI